MSLKSIGGWEALVLISTYDLLILFPNISHFQCDYTIAHSGSSFLRLTERIVPTGKTILNVILLSKATRILKKKNIFFHYLVEFSTKLLVLLVTLYASLTEKVHICKEKL